MESALATIVFALLMPKSEVAACLLLPHSTSVRRSRQQQPRQQRRLRRRQPRHRRQLQQQQALPRPRFCVPVLAIVVRHLPRATTAVHPHVILKVNVFANQMVFIRARRPILHALDAMRANVMALVIVCVNLNAR